MGRARESKKIGRSENMRRIRSKDSAPELELRSLIHRMGYRYRLHRPDLPGKPDLVFPSRSKVIFMHGCFWHQHKRCNEGRLPKSNLKYWGQKLTKNVERDLRNRRKLWRLGWRSIVIWECQMKNAVAVRSRVEKFLG